MNNYITGKIIKELREKKKMTQLELASIINVSDKTISKWENGRGLPDISLISTLANALDISTIELLNGEYITNKNISGNMLKSNFYVCPMCGNIIHSMGENVISCCGITLPILEAENGDDIIKCENVENEYFITVDHEMTKEHYISFIAYLNYERCEIVKLYPQQDAQARFFSRGSGLILAYCNRDGLIQIKV